MPFPTLRACAFTVLVCLATALPAHAQDAGCTQTNPCVWELTVDHTGFVDSSAFTASAGDWIAVNATNLDDVAHTVALSAYGVNLQIDSDADAQSAAFQVHVGNTSVTDSPSGKTLQLTVVNCDAQDYADGLCNTAGSTGTGSPKGTSSGTGRAPGLALPVMVAALAGVAILARRRT